MGATTSRITSLRIVYSAVYSDADQRKHQSSASLVFARWIHRWPVNSPHKWPVTRIMFPFDDVITRCGQWTTQRWPKLQYYLCRCTNDVLNCRLLNMTCAYVIHNLYLPNEQTVYRYYFTPGYTAVWFGCGAHNYFLVLIFYTGK